MSDISHSKPTINEEDVRAVVNVLTSGQLADSSQVALFEKELSAYIGQKGGVATNSGTNALHLALLCLANDNKDEVIIPSYVCISLLNAIYNAKLNPRIVDINEHNYNISLEEIKKAITNKTKAIIAPHLLGDPIENISEFVDLGLPVIEDCALSIGADINGKKIGSFSELSVFSFYATKVLTTGHGGMVLSDSEIKLDKLRDLTLYDNRNKYSQSFNFSLTDFQAALGRSQLSRLDDFLAKRREIAARYNNSFQDIDSIIVPPRPEGSIYFRYVIELESADDFIEKISKCGVNCRKPVFKPLHHYFNLNKNDYPNTERAYQQCVSVPIYPSIKEGEIESVIKKIVNL
jgi:perosamine synthetase